MRTVGYTLIFGLIGALSVLCMGPLGIAVAGVIGCVWGVLALEEQR